MTKTTIDIAIIGGGPVGLCTAIMAKCAGLSAVVFESKQGTIDKACGEGLMPSAVAILEKLGVKIQQHHPFQGIRYFDQKDNMAEGLFSQGPGFGIRRLALHQALHSRVKELNIPIIPKKVHHFEERENYVDIEGIQATYVIAADGLHSTTRKKLQLELPPIRPARMGIRQHFYCKPWSDFVEVYWSEHAECYITPVATDQVGIAIIFYKDHKPKGADCFGQLLAQFPAVQKRIQKAQPASVVRGAGMFEHRVSAPSKGRILLVGDASSYLDPITGEGLRLGFVAAEKAIELIQQQTIKYYPKEHWKLIRKYWVLTDGLLRLRRIPFLRTIMVPFLSRFPKLFGWIVSNLG